MERFKIMRFFQSGKRCQTLAVGLTLEQAKEWCSNANTSSRTAWTTSALARTRRHGAWFDGFENERG